MYNVHHHKLLPLRVVPRPCPVPLHGLLFLFHLLWVRLHLDLLCRSGICDLLCRTDGLSPGFLLLHFGFSFEHQAEEALLGVSHGLFLLPPLLRLHGRIQGLSQEDGVLEGVGEGFVFELGSQDVDDLGREGELQLETLYRRAWAEVLQEGQPLVWGAIRDKDNRLFRDTRHLLD